jgi:tripartite-type tricarboxylate transporter receptor subunit TctC
MSPQMVLSNRRAFLQSAAAAGVFIATGAQAQTPWPDHPVKIVIPYPAGGSTDVLSRFLAERLKDIFGQPFVIENRPGAGGNSGTGAAAKATPDGYTLVGGGSGPVAANATLYKVLGYDPEKDLEMIGPFAGFTIVVVASAKVPIHSLKELVENAKANPGKLNYGSVGIGSSQHLAGEFFSQINDVKLTHVPYRNIAQYGPDLIAGQVPLGFQWFPNVAGPIGSKGAIPLAVAGDKRIAALPDTPTTTELGMPQYKERGWFALLAPAGTPKPILEKLNKEMKAAVEDPQVKKGFETAGAETMWMPLDQVKKWHHDEIAKYRNIITKAGIAQIE